MRTATQALHSGHPVVMSACWYLDYNQEWSSYLAVDLTASARANVVEGSKFNRGHSRGGGSRGYNHGRNGRVSNREPRNLRSTGRRVSVDNVVVARNDTTVYNATSTSVDVHAALNHAQRMYLSLTELEEEEVGTVYNEATSASETTTAGPALHSNYFIPGGEASMWTERVDCANLECR